MEYGVGPVISGSHDGSGSLLLMIGAYLQLCRLNIYSLYCFVR